MTIIDTDGSPRSKRSLDAEVASVRPAPKKPRRTPPKKTAPDLTNKQLGRLAVRLFNGESEAKIAKELGVNVATLARLIKQAEKAGAFHYA